MVKLGGEEDVLQLGVGLHGVRAQLTADARLLEPAERRVHPHRRVGVDGERARVHLPGHAQRAAGVARPDRAGQAVDGVVGPGDRLVLGVEHQHGDDRAEDLLTGGGVVVGDGVQDRGREPEARPVRRGPGDQDGRVVDVTLRLRALCPGDQRAHVGGLVEGVADDRALDHRSQVLQELVGRGALDQHARAGTAAAGVAERRAAQAVRRPRAGRRRRRRSTADLPPSSSVTRAMRSAARRPMSLPTSVDPVNAILPTPGCSTSAVPSVRPGPLTTVNRPSGTPAAR